MQFVPNRKAPVWKFFKVITPPSKAKAQCNIGACGKIVPCANGGTSNVTDHLRVHHPLQYAEVKNARLSKSAVRGESESDLNQDEPHSDANAAERERPSSASGASSSSCNGSPSPMSSPSTPGGHASSSG